MAQDDSEPHSPRAADASAAPLSAEAERQRLHALFMQAPAAIAILRGPEHVYELSNPINNLALGRDPTGLPVRAAVPEFVAHGYVELLDEVYREGTRVVRKEAPVAMRQASGVTQTSYVNAIYEPLRAADGSVEGVLVFAYDVTELVEQRKRAERAEQQAKEAVRVRDEFISIAGHELRTPLSALKLQIATITRHLEKLALGEARLAQRFQKATTYIDRLENLIGELLDVSRIASGRLELRRETTDLAELASEVVDRFAETAEQAGCVLELSIKNRPIGEWDAGRIDQVITNLLSNAIKYGAQKPISLEISSEANVVKISVQDHGIGIAPEAHARVFERFERAVRAEKYAGLGLGLWICRQIIAAHAGKIELSSVEDAGTLVVVELPIAVPSGATSI